MNDRRALIARLAVVVAITLIAVPLARPGRAADDLSEARSVSGFDRVRLQGAFSADIVAGLHSTTVRVSGDPDVVKRVTTEVTDRTLTVAMRPGTPPFRRAPKLEIALPDLRGFINEGAGSIKISGLTGGDVEIENAGAATIAATGRAGRETLTLNGTGKIDTTAVDAHDVTVDNNGVGMVHVRASGSLIMNVNGVGEIRYTGNPAHVDSHVNGIGRISPL